MDKNYALQPILMEHIGIIDDSVGVMGQAECQS